MNSLSVMRQHRVERWERRAARFGLQRPDAPAHIRVYCRDASELERRDAMMRPATFNAERNTVEAVVATSNPVPRRDARGPYSEILDIAGADVEALRGAHVLNGHGGGGVNGVIGTVEDAWRENNQIVASIRFSSRPDVAGIIEDIRGGVIRSVSVGYEVSEWRDGRDGETRTRTAVKWKPREVSFVATSADPHARTRQREPSRRGAINRDIRELASRAGVAREVADDLIDRGADFTEARIAILEEAHARSRIGIRAAIQNDYTDPGLQMRAVENALYAKMTGTAATGPAQELRHRSVIDLMAHTLRVSGVHLRNDSPAEIFQRSLHTTSDFPTVLGNVVGRRLGELFRAAQSGASAIAATGTVRDFRPVTEARLTSFPSLEPVGENGEIKWGTLAETGESIAIASFARAIGITFAVAVNDDLGAVDRSVRDVAFATAQLKAKLIVAALSADMADGDPLFDAAHDNLAGAGAVPSETTLSAGRIAMAKQTPPGSDEPLGLSPAILLVPPELQTTSEKLVTSINPTVSADVSVFAGKLQVAVEPRLPNATQWFLFANPDIYATIRFLTLAGFEAPRLETNVEFDRLGTSYRVHWHVGAGPIDFRGAWKNPGA